MLSWIREQLIGTGAVIRTPFGERRLTYADYVASGRLLRHVELVLQQHVLPWYANTHTEDSYTGARTTHLMHEAAEYVKSCVGADSTCKIIFSGTGSTGAIKRLQDVLGLSVPSNLRERVVAALDPLERPVVYVGPYEHHSNEVTWRETIAEVIEIPLSPTGFIDLEVLHNALHDPKHAARPRIGSFSAASNVTGLISNTRRIARVLHGVGAYACFDFAASAPYLPIDMKPGCPDGYDAIFISPHKFVGGPGSPGVLIFNEAMYRITTPSTPGGGTVDYVSSRIHHYVRDIEVREDAGTPGILQKMRAALAFWVKEQVGVETIAEREKHYIRTALHRLRLNPRIQVLGNLEAHRLAVVSFLIRSGDAWLHPRFVVRLLNDLFGIQARGGCACAGPYGHFLLGICEKTSQNFFQCILSGYEGIKPGWTRVNFNYFITEDEFRFLLDAIEFVALYGERFLPLYEFNWRTGAWKHPQDLPFGSLFDPPSAPVEDEDRAVPWQHYLEEARQMAEKLDPSPTARPIPPEVPRELVSFRV